VAAKKKSPPLLYADTETSADVLYFGRVGAPDPFIALGARGKKYAVVNALEFGRMRKGSAFDRVLPLEPYVQRARSMWPGRKVGAAEVIFLLARELKQPRFTVPSEFPTGIYEKLFELGLDLEVSDGPLFPAREIKTPAEIAAIRYANRASARGIAAAEHVLRASKMQKGAADPSRPASDERTAQICRRGRVPRSGRHLGEHDCRGRRPSLRSP